MRQQSGFTIIELMVGIGIGLLSTLVIMQAFSGFEGQKRTTSAGSDAQTNGALALYAVSREGKMAGYGLLSRYNGISALGCPMRGKTDSGALETLTLAPVVITNGASGAPDSLRFLASAADTWALPSQIVLDHAASSTQFFLDSTLGISTGDLMLAIPSVIDSNNWCTLFQVTSVGGSGASNRIEHTADALWNPDPASNIFPSAGYQTDDWLVNLGTVINRSYSIVNQSLRLSDRNMATNVTTDTDLYNDIVDMQAEYGVDDGSAGGTAGDGIVDGYTTTTPTNATGWERVLAVRLALLVRSSQWEKTEVTTAAPAWTSTSFVMTNIADWKHYRYRVYETVFPLRNMIWR